MGPNGSGKSNFVDAVRWVLGEQSAKQLRGARMDEVIFAGNNHRRPLGMAEVTLTFDNSDGVLATPFAEIAVTRRVYRTGESEYFLNRSQVRLRDIMELLLGTGLGPDASAIISQGQIDAILSAKPGERREIFEEAAGTSKYQARKREAQRRLEQTEANALRVNDVLAEIEQQVPALETQVRRAKRYRKASQTLRDLEILSFVRKSAARREERARLRTFLDADDADRAQADALRERLSADLNAARYDEYQSTVALDERTTARAECGAEVRDAATAHASAHTRCEEAERRCMDRARDVSGAERAVEDAASRIDTLTRELGASRTRRDAALVAAEEAAGAEAAGTRAWETAYATLRELEDRRARAAADAAESDTAAQAAAAERERLARHRSTVEADRAAAAERAAELGRRDAALAAESLACERAVREHDEAARAAAAERETRSAEMEQCRSALDEARAAHVATQARLAAHEEFEEQGAGLPSGVRAVLAAVTSSELHGPIGVVAGLLEVDERYATAIDVALGARAHDVVTRTSADARAAIDLLKRTRAGRATFLPLDLARQSALALAADFSSCEGFVGRAIDLVRCAPDARPAIEHALNDVIVFTWLGSALQAAAHNAAATIVTLDGELIRGATIAGGASEGDAGPLARRAQLAELRREVEATATSARAASERLEIVGAALNAAQAAVERAVHERTQADLRRHDAASARDHVREELSALETRCAELAGALEQSVTEVERSEAAAERYRRRADAARDAAARLESERSQAAAEADRLHEALSALRDRHRSAAAEAAALVERVAQAGDDVEAARADHATSQRIAKEHAAELAQARAELDRLRDEASALVRKKAEAEGRLAEVEAQVEGLRAKRDALAQQARDAEQALEHAGVAERTRSLDAQAHRIRVAEIDAELALLQETFAQNPATAEECDAVAQRYAGFEGEADAEIRRLRDEVARLGNVNLNALDDQAALLERRDFLRKQLDDLQQARAGILGVIAEIDAESLRQFNATFERIAAAFSETFSRLFTGGVGKIWLGEAEDPTQAGIEIAVQPPGKKMQSLNLLSGGERAMTAAALVFAILQVRPSPFYIFDEIDAALDEANIGRFGSMLREIATRAQTVIITHNKATMTLADRIYGVTMGEPGVSNILSLALEQVSA